MPRYIDADKLIRVTEAVCDAIGEEDLVKVVRCRNCEYWDETAPMSTTDPTFCRCRLRRETDATTAEDFCSYGRRKEKTDER